MTRRQRCAELLNLAEYALLVGLLALLAARTVILL